MVILFGSLKYSGPTQDKFLLAALIAGALGTIYTLSQLHLEPTRHFRTKILASLVKALKPLEPKREDLANSFERCRTLGRRIRKVTQVDEVWSLLR